MTVFISLQRSEDLTVRIIEIILDDLSVLIRRVSAGCTGSVSVFIFGIAAVLTLPFLFFLFRSLPGSPGSRR